MLVENELNELPRKVETISTKKITDNWINECKILDDIKYFSSGIL